MALRDLEHASQVLHERRVAFVGRLASLPKREAQQLIRQHGGIVSDEMAADVDLVVIGEDDLPLGETNLDDPHSAWRQAAEQGTLEVITETELWQRLGLVEEQQNVHRLYTPAMLAQLLGVSLAVVRRWHRRGLIVPARLVRKLPYFDFREVATARRLAELLAAGVSAKAIEKKLASLAKLLPGVERPLAQLSVIVEGKQLLLRQGDGLFEPGGQLRFDFGSSLAGDEDPPEATQLISVLSMEPHRRVEASPTSPSHMLALAGELEDLGQLEAAAEMYRAAMAAGGPDAEICFRLAEVLYQLGEVGAARERYYMAIELDEDYVEARANLGCVLAEAGEHDLAEAAFQGALAYHGDYPDVHYHLARTLDELDRETEAEEHWRTFIELAPDSPWAAEARMRMNEVGLSQDDLNQDDLNQNDSAEIRSADDAVSR